MIRMQEVAPGTLTVSRELIDGQLRLTYRRRRQGAHPEQPRYVATSLTKVVQYRGPAVDPKNVKYRRSRTSRQWTDGLFPVEVL